MTGASAFEQLGSSNEAGDQLLLARFGVLFLRLSVAREGRERRSREEEWEGIHPSHCFEVTTPFFTVMIDDKGIRGNNPVEGQLERIRRLVEARSFVKSYF